MKAQRGSLNPKVDVDAIENPANETAGLQPDGDQAEITGEARAIDRTLRHQLIATAAYLRAERRQFQNGTPEDDWLEAEAEIDRQLGKAETGMSAKDAHNVESM